MQMSIMQKGPNINLVDGMGESIQWSVGANRLRERVPICDVIVIGVVKRVWFTSLLFVVALLIKCINEYLPKHHTKYYWDNSVDLNREFLTAQMCIRLYQTCDNHSRLSESILNLQKEDTFMMDLFVPEAIRLSYSSYTNVFAFFTSDDRLIWVDDSTSFYFWIQQLYRKVERSFLAQTISEYLSELREIAKSYQYHSPNRHLRCKGFSPGFTILTYNFKLPRRFCTLLHRAPKSEMLSPVNPEQKLYTSIDRQEDAVIDISMVISPEFAQMVWYQTAELYF